MMHATLLRPRPAATAWVDQFATLNKKPAAIATLDYVMRVWNSSHNKERGNFHLHG